MNPIPKEKPRQIDEKGNPLTFWGGLAEPKQETKCYCMHTTYCDCIIEEVKLFKHEVKPMPKEEILANRSNAYKFIDFDKQETLEGGITITHVGKETLKEVAKNYSERHQDVSENLGKYLVSAVFIDGAEWQKERSYSKEEVRKITLDFFYHWWNSKGTNTKQGFDKWFEQIKKK